MPIENSSKPPTSEDECEPTLDQLLAEIESDMRFTEYDFGAPMGREIW